VDYKLLYGTTNFAMSHTLLTDSANFTVPELSKFRKTYTTQKCLK